MDYTERLRCLAINDARFVHDVGGGDAGSRALDPKSLALVRLGGLVAVSAGASAPEIVDVLVGLIPIARLPCVVAAAPKRLPPRRGNVR